MRKIYLLITIVLITTIIFTGCKNDVKENVNKGKEDDKVEEIVAEVGTDSYSTLEPTYKIDKFIWDKEYELFDISELKLTKNWFDGIYIGNTLISSTEPTDISSIPNYFFDGNKDYSPLERAYHNSHYAFGLNTDKVRIGKIASCALKLESTTFGDNLIIESVQLTGISNILEDRNNELKSTAPYQSNDNFGFGSTYSYVSSVLGKDNGQATNDTGDFNITTVVYQEKNAEMTLIFSWKKDDTIDNAILTSIYWKPITVSTMLHNQDGIYEFEGYTDTKDTNITIKENK